MKVTVQYEIEVSEEKLRTLIRKDMRELRKDLNKTALQHRRFAPAKAFYASMEPMQRYLTLSALHTALVNGGFSAARAKYPTLVHKNYGNIVMHYFPLMKDIPTNVEVEG